MDSNIYTRGQEVKMRDIIERVTLHVEDRMSDRDHDASHNFAHIQRVLALANMIKNSERNLRSNELYSDDVITLSALVHDLWDRKYPQPDGDALQLLTEFGVPRSVAQEVQIVVSHISFSNEIRDTATMQLVLSRCPEVAVVQDADRLDALGAIGIGRAFTYAATAGQSSSPTGDSMLDTIKHMEAKLLKLASMMKTETGRTMAKRRTKKIREFSVWWKEECALLS